MVLFYADLFQWFRDYHHHCGLELLALGAFDNFYLCSTCYSINIGRYVCACQASPGSRFPLFTQAVSTNASILLQPFSSNLARKSSDVPPTCWYGVCSTANQHFDLVLHPNANNSQPFQLQVPVTNIGLCGPSFGINAVWRRYSNPFCDIRPALLRRLDLSPLPVA